MIEDITIASLEKALACTSIKHKAILNNIANVNTPGYKRVDVNFKSQLASILKDSNILNSSEFINKLKSIEPEIISQENTSLRNDGNNVDIDKEMAVMAKNTMEYEYYVSLLAKKFNIIKLVVNEGRK